MKTKLERAIEFATIAHTGQVRKYTGEPYVTHPIAVMEIVKTVPHTEEMLIAAVLHDTVEDTDVTLNDVESEFGPAVATLVEHLTDVSKLEDGNRAIRKEIDRKHIAKASKDAMTVKLADLIHNTESIVKYGGGFAGIYIKEKKKLLKVLKQGDRTLMREARRKVEEYYKR